MYSHLLTGITSGFYMPYTQPTLLASNCITYGGGGGFLQASSAIAPALLYLPTSMQACLPPFGPAQKNTLFKIVPDNFVEPLIGSDPPCLREHARCKAS
jgi:hypothetical protein